MQRRNNCQYETINTHPTTKKSQPWPSNTINKPKGKKTDAFNKGNTFIFLLLESRVEALLPFYPVSRCLTLAVLRAGAGGVR